MALVLGGPNRPIDPHKIAALACHRRKIALFVCICLCHFEQIALVLYTLLLPAAIEERALARFRD